MSRRKNSGRPKRQKASKVNFVAAAVELAGGAMAVAKLCGVTRQLVYIWVKEWRVERLIDALKLSRASGIPIEKLAGEAYRPDRIPQPKRPDPSSEKPDSE